MAISVSTASIPSFSFERSTTCISSRFSAPTSLQFPLRPRRLRVGNETVATSPRKRQTFPRAEAKKQTFSSFDDLLENSEKTCIG